jgi:hypothetical protein
VLGTAGGQVQVVAGQVGELVGLQPLDVLAGLVTAGGLAQQHGQGGPPAEVGRESVDFYLITPGGGRVR